MAFSRKNLDREDCTGRTRAEEKREEPQNRHQPDEPLLTATTILSSGGVDGATDAEAVIALAEKLERWVTRGT
jgi:hypothetical protein